MRRQFAADTLESHLFTILISQFFYFVHVERRWLKKSDVFRFEALMKNSFFPPLHVHICCELSWFDYKHSCAIDIPSVYLLFMKFVRSVDEQGIASSGDQN